MDYDTSDVATRNNKKNGYWIILENMIYDVSQFVDRHPGGCIILENHAGRDATTDFKAVSHNANVHISALLSKLHIGTLRLMHFNEESIQATYKRWIEILYLIVEMQNTLWSDYSFLNMACTQNDDPKELTAQKIDLVLETHSRFVNGYISLLINKFDKLSDTLSIPDISLAVIPSYIITPNRLSFIRNSIALIRRKNPAIVKSGSHYQPLWNIKMFSYSNLIEQEDTALISEIKTEVINWVKLFEKNEIRSSTITSHATSFISKISAIFTRYADAIEEKTKDIFMEETVHKKTTSIETHIQAQEESF